MTNRSSSNNKDYHAKQTPVSHSANDRVGKLVICISCVDLAFEKTNDLKTQRGWRAAPASQQLFPTFTTFNILKYIWKQPGQHLQLFSEEVSLSLCLYAHFVNVREVQSEPALRLCLRLLIQTFCFVNVPCGGYVAASNREHAPPTIIRIVFQKARALDGAQVHSGIVSYLPCSPLPPPSVMRRSAVKTDVSRCLIFGRGCLCVCFTDFLRQSYLLL